MSDSKQWHSWVIKRNRLYNVVDYIKKSCPEQKVFEVTIKHTYMVNGSSYVDADFIKKEWFGTHKNISHAHRDNSLVGNADELIEVKEIK